jgi:hypothetical protein
MKQDPKLFDLLPALYRLRDTTMAIAQMSPAERSAILAKGESIEENAHGPLYALMAILADQVAVLDENLDQLYDDQFIETCAEWVVPYIGQLVGSRDLIPIPDAPVSQRSEVANTISYRRRKGTAAVIEQLARDITGWNANVVEYFQLLATTQYMNHIRLENQSITGLTKWEPLEYIGTPFDKTPRTVDVRNISSKRGKYNIPNIGIFLWRLNTYTLEKVPAFKIHAHRYTFNPFGEDRPLYNHPIPETEISHLAEPIHIPNTLSTRILDRYLEQYYGPGKSILIYVDGVPVTGSSTPGDTLRDHISICDLSDIKDALGNTVGWGHTPPVKIAIDPVLGRIAFPPGITPTTVETDYYYAFSAEMGGGGYEREPTFTKNHLAFVTVSDDSPIDPSINFPTIQAALNHLMTLLNDPEKNIGVVEIKKNKIYKEDLIFTLPTGKTVELRGADKTRPIILPNTGIQINADDKTKLILNGLLIKGKPIEINPLSKLQALDIKHCTLVPAITTIPGSPRQTSSLPAILINTADTTVTLEKSIVGAIHLRETCELHSFDSILDGGAIYHPVFAGIADLEPAGILQAENCTFIGKVHTRIMELASNCIFFGGLSTQDTWGIPVKAQRLQEGCTRFSWFPVGSRIPRPFNCQPISDPDKKDSKGNSLKNDIRVKPMFNSVEYGDPDYCQLSPFCAPEIARGADDESEMGAFHHLYTPQRLSNLQTRLDEYLRFGLEAGIFFAT